MIARAPQFAESLTFATVDLQAAATARLRDTRLRPPVHRMLRGAPRRRGAAADGREPGGESPSRSSRRRRSTRRSCSATRDYVEKNGFSRVVIGLSGGIDSTLVGLIAVDALGADRVTCVSMPSRYSSAGTP